MLPSGGAGGGGFRPSLGDGSNKPGRRSVYSLVKDPMPFGITGPSKPCRGQVSHWRAAGAPLPFWENVGGNLQGEPTFLPRVGHGWSA